jgi:hypothetical protein
VPLIEGQREPVQEISPEILVQQVNERGQLVNRAPSVCVHRVGADA